jgi:hypothetical protein
MTQVTRLKVGPVAVLVLLGLLMLLALNREGLTPEKTERGAVELEDSVIHDSYATVAVVGLVALFAFVMWTALRAKEGEDKAIPPARESGASDKTAPR